MNTTLGAVCAMPAEAGNQAHVFLLTAGQAADTSKEKTGVMNA